MKKQKNKGFSMVELIIVIAIMAILAGILAPVLIKYVRRARRTVDIDTAAEIARAFSRTLTDNEDLDASTSGIYYGMVAWNSSNTIADPPRSIIDYAMAEYNRLPVSKTNKDWFWVVDINPWTGEVRSVKLADRLGSGATEYEVWPKYDAFLNMD